MPALSSTMTEGKIVEWTKSVGDAIDVGETIMVVESDKADMDVEAFEAGFLAAVLVDEGDAAPVGAPVGIIAANEADVAVIQACERWRLPVPPLLPRPPPPPRLRRRGGPGRRRPGRCSRWRPRPRPASPRRPPPPRVSMPPPWPAPARAAA